jgi:hypothetical protein
MIPTQSGISEVRQIKGVGPPPGTIGSESSSRDIGRQFDLHKVHSVQVLLGGFGLMAELQNSNSDIAILAKRRNQSRVSVRFQGIIGKIEYRVFQS